MLQYVTCSYIIVLATSSNIISHHIPISRYHWYILPPQLPMILLLKYLKSPIASESAPWFAG